MNKCFSSVVNPVLFYVVGSHSECYPRRWRCHRNERRFNGGTVWSSPYRLYRWITFNSWLQISDGRKSLPSVIPVFTKLCRKLFILRRDNDAGVNGTKATCITLCSIFLLSFTKSRPSFVNNDYFYCYAHY